MSTKFYIYSETEGTGSSIEITGGSGAAILGLTVDRYSGMNTLDAQLGDTDEPDPDLRVRRVQELRLQGVDAIEAIVAHVSEVENVTECVGYHNPTGDTDENGLPPHSFEIVVTGGADSDIAEAIWTSQPAGIEPYGSEGPISITDSQGITQDIYFSRPDPIEIYIIYDVTINTATFPEDGHDQIKAILATNGNELKSGEDVIVWQMECAIRNITGVIDVTEFKIGSDNPPTQSVNVTILTRERAVFDTSRIDWRGDL